MGIKYLSVNLGRSSFDVVVWVFLLVNIVLWDLWYCDDIIVWVGVSEVFRLVNFFYFME